MKPLLARLYAAALAWAFPIASFAAPAAAPAEQWHRVEFEHRTGNNTWYTLHYFYRQSDADKNKGRIPLFPQTSAEPVTVDARPSKDFGWSVESDREGLPIHWADGAVCAAPTCRLTTNANSVVGHMVQADPIAPASKPTTAQVPAPPNLKPGQAQAADAGRCPGWSADPQKPEGRKAVVECAFTDPGERAAIEGFLEKDPKAGAYWTPQLQGTGGDPTKLPLVQRNLKTAAVAAMAAELKNNPSADAMVLGLSRKDALAFYCANRQTGVAAPSNEAPMRDIHLNVNQTTGEGTPQMDAKPASPTPADAAAAPDQLADDCPPAGGTTDLNAAGTQDQHTAVTAAPPPPPGAVDAKADSGLFSNGVKGGLAGGAFGVFAGLILGMSPLGIAALGVGLAVGGYMLTRDRGGDDKTDAASSDKPATPPGVA